jgi:gamma-glutamyl phosphate reductase
MAGINEITKQIKADSFKMSLLGGEVRNSALDAIAKALLQKKAQILEANRADLDRAEEAKLGRGNGGNPHVGEKSDQRHRLDENQHCYRH